MNHEQKLVRQFHYTMDVPVCHSPEVPSIAQCKLRGDLLQEEVRELADALAANDLVQIADALADIMYIVYGTAIVCGIDVEPVFNEVHRSNMTKVDLGGRVLRRADGKILKPATYSPPNIAPILEAQK